MKTTRILKLVVLSLVAAALLWFAFRGVSIRSIIVQIKAAKIPWVLFSVLFSVVALFSRTYRWNLLLEPMGYKPRFRKTFYALMTGYLANLVFPRLGEVTRCGSLSKAESIPFNVLLGTVIVERAIDVISLLICLIITTIIEFNRLGSFLKSSITDPVLQKLKSIGSSPLMVLSIAFFLIALFFAFRHFQKKRSDKTHDRITQLLKGVIDGIRSVGKLKRPWSFVFHSVFIWFMYYLSVYVAFFSMPSTSHLNYGAALFLLVAAGVAMSAPVQGGIGAYHLLVSQGLLLYGLTQQEGLAFATLLHGLQIIVMVALGSISFLLLALDDKQKDMTSKETTNLKASIE